MAKKCPPGVICFENNTMYFVLAFFFVGVAIVYFSVLKNQLPSSSKIASSIPQFPSPFNIDYIPKFGRGLTFAKDVLNDPYVPPLKNENIHPSYDYGTVPINVRTRQYDASYRQVGFLAPEAGGNGGNGNTLKDNLIPLMGRPLDRPRDKWNFYTINNSTNGIKLPIIHKGKSCTNDYGCDNMYNEDTVYVEGLKQPYKVTMYDTETMRYLPFI